MIIEKLKKLIESRVGYPLRYPKDCDFLSKDLRENYNCSISSSTLKRLFGFSSPSARPHLYTLDQLSRLLGYPSWDEFCYQEQGPNNSPDEISFLDLEDLKEGQKFILEFPSSKSLLLQNLKNGHFLVLESVGGKIQSGFKLEIHNIVKFYPLVCHKIFSPQDVFLGSAIIGKIGGIRKISIL